MKTLEQIKTELELSNITSIDQLVDLTSFTQDMILEDVIMRGVLLNQDFIIHEYKSENGNHSDILKNAGYRVDAVSKEKIISLYYKYVIKIYLTKIEKLCSVEIKLSLDWFKCSVCEYFEIIEKPKQYWIKGICDGEEITHRPNKSGLFSLNVIESNISTGFSYYQYCLPEDVEKTKKHIIDHMNNIMKSYENKINKYKIQINSII